MCQVFISYASEDYNEVDTINNKLKENGIPTWMDKRGQRSGGWKQNTLIELRHSRYYLQFLSNIAIDKLRNRNGMISEEWECAYDISRHQTEDKFKIIPIRLEECDRGDHILSGKQQYDLFGQIAENQFEKLTNEIKVVNKIDRNKIQENNPYLNYFYAKDKEIKEESETTLFWDVKKGNAVKLFSVYYKPPGLHKNIEIVDEWLIGKKGLKKVLPKIYEGADTKNWSYFLLKIDDVYYTTIHIKITKR